MSPFGAQRDSFGGFVDDPEAVIAPIPARREHLPREWGSLSISADEVVMELTGWRALVAMKRRLVIPVDAVVSVRHDPGVRSSVRAKLRRRAGRSGLFRLGSYHSFDGWSFWSIGLGRNAVVLEAKAGRYRYVVVEVANPPATVAELSAELARRSPVPEPPARKNGEQIAPGDR